MFYVHVAPETGGKQTYIIESMNNFAILAAAVLLMLYTDFVPDLKVRFRLGMWFVYIVTGILALNFSKMLWNMLRRFYKQAKKNKVQKTYEARFKQYAAVERLSYIMHLERITLYNLNMRNRLVFEDYTQQEINERANYVITHLGRKKMALPL